MRTVYAQCPRKLDDGSSCDAEQEIEVGVFYEGGWVAQFETPTGCPDGHVWTREEAAQVTEHVTIAAVEPDDPDDGDVEL